MPGIFILIAHVTLVLSDCPYDSLDYSGTLSCNLPKFMVDSRVCATQCPTLFPEDQNNCIGCYNYCSHPDPMNAVLFTLEFYGFQDISLDRIRSPDLNTWFFNPGGISYNDASQNSPLPTVDRGFYFAKTSALICDTSFIPGIYFILNLWIKSLEGGEILNVQISSTSYMRIWIQGGYFKFYALIYNSAGSPSSVSGSSLSSYSTSWHYVSIFYSQDNCSGGSLNFHIDGNADYPSSLSNYELSFPDGPYTWTLGNVGVMDSFRGFIYWIQARVDNDEFSPISTFLVDCDDKQYWDGSSCQNCDSSCSAWPWCIRGSDCSICYSVDCNTCSGYSLAGCYDCKTGVLPFCCDYLAADCTQTWTNTYCSIGVPNEGVCLYGAPYGSSNCGGYYCFTVLTADFNGPFAGSYGSALITGTSTVSYNYWNNAEGPDPLPAKNRGLYFNSAQYLSGSINLSNTWSMGMWIYAISGTIISHSTNKLTIKSDGTINFDLETWDGSSASYTHLSTFALNQWIYVSYSVGFTNKATTLTPYLNNAPETGITIPNYVFRLPDGEKLYIGKGTPKFNGFISYFQLWGTTVTEFSVSYNLYGFTGGIVSTLWPCDYSHYYDGSSCQSCLSSSSCTMGCTRGTSCYICDDFLCSQCTSFSPNTCTQCISNASGSPCQCIAGFYQPTNQALCSPCYTNCASCTGSQYTSCTSCNSGYFLYITKLCLLNCPTGYIENSTTNACSFSSNIGLSLTLYDQIKLDSVSAVQVGPTSNIYPTYETGDPYPQYLQGYYFKTSSYMLASTVIGPYFTISIWIYPISPGSIAVKTVSGSKIFYLEINGASPKLSLILSNSSSLSVLSSQNILINAWSYIAFTGKIDASNTFTISSYFNSLTTESATSLAQAYFQDQSTGTFYIGKSDTNGFVGFLYNLKLFNTENYQFSDYTVSSCSSSCTQCPSDHNCPKACQFLEFFNGSSCESCSGSCTNGCKYSSSSGTCTLCKTKECYQCDSFSGSCSSCVTDAESDGSGGCKCKANTFWISGSCDICDVLCSVCKQTVYFECAICVTGTQMVSDICLNGCPYGYGAGCAVVSTAVIDQLFDNDYQGSYGIFITGTSSSTYQHFVSPEAVDPIPAYERGLYFDGNMYLESSLPVILSHSFSIAIWTYVISDGDTITKNYLQVTSNGSINARVYDNMQGYSVNSLTQISSLIGWSFLSIVIAYTSSATVFEIYINGNLVNSLNNPDLIFRDEASTNLQLGKGSSSGFVGFLYYFQLWNVRITDFLSIINSFTFCGAGQKASCLPECLLNEYKTGVSCSPCSSCLKGCVRSNSCNVCYDTLCLVCTGFDVGKCTQCVTNAYESLGSCFCNPTYANSADGLSCVSCPSECSACTVSVYNKCTACFSGFFFYASTGQCLSECPSGYTKNSVANTCYFSSNLGISLDLTDQILLDTVSGFKVGNSNANIYPVWSDINDPIPSYKRGYYFKFSNYLSSTVVIAPSFTISIWTKPLGAGILMTKYTSSDILKITIDLSGYIALSIIFSDSTSDSLTTSTSILNSWHFISFTGQIQSDGKTTLTVYINTVSINSMTTTALTYFKDTISGTLYVGNDETFGTSGFYGFLAQLMIYNSYNHQSDDYTTSSCVTGCSSCPANHQCLSECDFNKYPDSCAACSSCSKGCVNNLSCNLCRDKECYECATFSGECSSCITNAYKLAGHCTCLTNYLWVSSTESCELCDSICESCSTLKFNGCIRCVSGHYLIQSLCMTFCPIGYTVNGKNCNTDPAYTNSFVFNLKPHQIKDIVTDLKSNIPVLTGKDNKFYPNYDTTDPIPAIYRGYYFTGSSYMQLPPYSGAASPLFTFAPKFTISAWIKPITGTGVIFSKQSNSGLFKKYISFELINKAPSLTLTLKDLSTITYTSSNPSLEATLSQWNFILAISSISSTPQQTISLSTNGVSETSSDLHASWLNDLENSFLITIGATHLDATTLTSFFNGFLWDLKIYNTVKIVSSLTSASCTGCSLCPIDNSNTCLDNCPLNTYWNGNSCASCSTGCLNLGCARNDKSCNLCKDVICEICDDYTNACITCKTNANLIGTTCQCNSGYYWESNNEDCELCDVTCKTCTSPSSSDCLLCADEYYISSGICKLGCPQGYSSTPNGCVLAKAIFDLDLNTLNGVIYDKASSIPVITGSTGLFYPDYEIDDPIPAYLRGFYFNGQSSILRLPEYSNYTSPQLVITSTFTISIWLNIENSDSSLLSKHNLLNNYSTLYSILLIASKPTISLIINSSPFTHNCQISLKNYEWSHIVFTLEISSGYNILSSYINGLSDSSAMTGYGTFTDIGPHTTTSIGAQISSSTAYNFYQGFIYSIQMFNTVKPINSLSSVSCTENCNVCPKSQICIPNCKINEYWSGPAYNKCNNCSTNCKKSCRDLRDTCSLCDNLLCKDCIGYSAEDCVACKENAIQTDSCICDDSHVLDTSNNSSCIPIMPGGYRGPDGVFYPCPNLCGLCESLTKCTTCVENASLISNLCYCNLGFNGTKSCTLVPFSVKLSVFSDNSLCLTFSESLAKNLTTFEFIVVISNQGEITCKIEQINSTCYYISLNIKETISKGTLATFTFLDLKEVKSVSNGILNSSYFTVNLNSYDPDPYSPAIAAAASQATVIAQSAVVSALALSFINTNPSSLWSIINTIQILSYLTLSGIPFSEKLRAFLNNLNSFNLFPNMFSYIIDQNEGNNPYSQAQEFGFETNLILINQGNDFTLILVSIAVLPLVFYFSRCSHKWIGKKFRKTIKSYQFSFYMRFWIQCYLELGAAVTIGIIDLEFMNATQIINSIICLFVCISLIITPVAFFWFSYKSKTKIISHNKKFFSWFGSFFYEFRTDQKFFATQYYLVFFVRRLIYIANLVYLRDYPKVEVTVNIVLSLMVILHLLIYWPFKDLILQISNLISEILICVIMGSTAAYLFNFESNVINKVEDSIVVITVVIIGVQLLASITLFVRAVYEFVNFKLNNRKIDKAKILPIQSQLTKKVTKKII